MNAQQAVIRPNTFQVIGREHQSGRGDTWILDSGANQYTDAALLSWGGAFPETGGGDVKRMSDGTVRVFVSAD